MVFFCTQSHADLEEEQKDKSNEVREGRFCLAFIDPPGQEELSPATPGKTWSVFGPR